MVLMPKMTGRLSHRLLTKAASTDFIRESNPRIQDQVKGRPHYSLGTNE